MGHDAHDLTDDTSNVKMMLALLWLLILRYSVKQQLEDDAEGKQTKTAAEAVDTLLVWTQQQVKKSCDLAGTSTRPKH